MGKQTATLETARNELVTCRVKGEENGFDASENALLGIFHCKL